MQAAPRPGFGADPQLQGGGGHRKLEPIRGFVELVSDMAQEPGRGWPDNTEPELLGVS